MVFNRKCLTNEKLVAHSLDAIFDFGSCFEIVQVEFWNRLRCVLDDGDLRRHWADLEAFCH